MHQLLKHLTTLTIHAEKKAFEPQQMQEQTNLTTKAGAGAVLSERGWVLVFEAGSEAVLQRYVIIWFLLASPTLCKKCFVILIVCWLLEPQKTLDNASCGQQRPVVLVAQHWGLGITCRPSTAPKKTNMKSPICLFPMPNCARSILTNPGVFLHSNRKFTKVGFRLHFSWPVSQNSPLCSRMSFFRRNFQIFH